MRSHAAVCTGFVVVAALLCALAGCGEDAETQTSSVASPSPPPVKPSPHLADQASDDKPHHPQGKAPARRPVRREAAEDKPRFQAPEPKKLEKGETDQNSPKPSGCPSPLSTMQCKELAQRSDSAPRQPRSPASSPHCPDAVDQSACRAAQEAQENGTAEGERQEPGQCPQSFSPVQCRELEEEISGS
jgi:hypothetical protein